MSKEEDSGTIQSPKNEKQKDVLIFTLNNCIPVKYEFGALNAMESTVLIETMEFEYHSMKTELG